MHLVLPLLVVSDLAVGKFDVSWFGLAVSQDMSFGRAPSNRPCYTDVAKAPSATVSSPDDITQEAMRRLEENKRIAEQKIREAAILNKMKELEYDALPKCKHGNVADAMLHIEHLKKYNVARFNLQLYYTSKYACLECIKEIKEAEAEKAKAEAKLLKDKEEAEKWERWRQAQEAHKAAMKKRVEELKTKKDVVNACDFDETTHDTHYLIRQSNPALGVIYMPVREILGGTLYYLLRDNNNVAVPAVWNTQYDDGLIPFLPVCPVCKKQNIMLSNGNSVHIHSVICHNHYSWDATTNTHKKQIFQQQHVQKWTPEVVCYQGGGNMPVYKMVLEYVPVMKDWDPKDPDGSIAAEAAKQKQISDIERQVAELQTKIANLKA